MTEQEKNKRFCELAGICWHLREIAQMGFAKCSCGEEFSYGYELYNHIRKNNPDFSDAREVLKVIIAGEEFLDYIGGETIFRSNIWKKVALIPVDYITTPGKLRDAWCEWVESKQ
jgi:hypothetical protein